MTPVQLVEFVAGAAVVALGYYDLFQSVVLPRPAVGKFRFTSYFTRNLWRAWRWLGVKQRPERRENFLAVFAPAALLLNLALWGLALVVGFGLILHSLAAEIHPATINLGTSLYFSTVCLLTVGFGDIVPTGPIARTVVLVEAASGLGLVAMVISLLFSLYRSFQAREESVVALDAMAGAPPSGLQILETVAKYRMPDELRNTFDEWRRWSAAVLESHLAYPILTFFRSSHDNEAWLNSFGAVMDAAVLVISTVEDSSEGAARLMFKVGGHLVEDFGWYFHLAHVHEPGVEREEFESARERLARAGYVVRDAEQAWRAFSTLRSDYASPLNQLALWLAILPAQWIGDRSYLPHRRAAAAPAASKPVPQGAD